MVPASIVVVQLLGEIIAQKFIEENILAKFNEKQIKRKITDVVERTLRETINDFPDAEVVFNNLNIHLYLSDPIVQNELSKLVQSENTAQPINDVLIDRWLKHSSGKDIVNIQIIIDSFLVKLTRNLWEIPELNELLHIKQQRGLYELVVHYLPSIQRYVSEISSNLPSSAEAKDDSEKAIVNTIELCKSLLRQDSPSAALAQLRTLETKIQNQSISNLTRSKVFALMGGCNLDLGDIESSTKNLSRAYQLSPKDPDAIANIAVVNLINQNFDEAIKFADEAISLKPSGTNARGVKFEALARKNNFERVDELIEENQLDDSNYVRTVGIVLSTLPESSKAEKYLRLGLAQSPDDFYIGMSLCKVLTDKVSFLHKHPTKGFDKQEVVNILNEVHSLIDVIIIKTQKGDNRFKLLQALASRAVTNAMMGNFESAKVDCDAVLAEDLNHPLALQNRALLALGEKDYLYAISLFSRLPEDILFDETISIGLIRSYLGAKQSDQALSFIERAEQHNSTKDYLFLKAWAHIQKGDLESADKLKEGVLSNPKDSKTYEIVGYIDQQLHNYEEAISDFEKAYNLCPDEDQKCFLALQLAQIYYDLHRFAESVEWFDKSRIDLATDLILARLYVGALYWSNNYEKAISFARSTREGGMLDKHLLKIEAYISEFLGDLSNALNLSQNIVLIDPLDLHNKMNCARLLFRLDKYDEAISLLNEIDINNLTPVELMITAEMYSFIGSDDKAISMGYLAFSRGKESAELHMGYLSLFLRLEKNLKLEMPVIVPNTAILLEGENEQRWMKILSDVKPNEGNWEYSPDSQPAKLLLGHKVGDLILYKDFPLEKITYKVKEIQSIYVRAFQEIFSEFGARFPDDSSLQKIQFKNDDVTPFLSTVAKMGVFSDKITDLYKTGVLSAEQFAKISRRPKILTMRALQITKDFSVFASQGSSQEQNDQNKSASDAVDITISISALLTVQYLGIQNACVERFGNIYIHQRILDEIDQTLFEIKHEKGSGRTNVGFHEGRFFWSEIPEGIIVDEINALEVLHTFVKDHCQIVAIQSRFSNDLLEIQDIKSNPIGELSLMSVLVAKQLQTPLYNDDLVVSLYAKSKFDVNAFWTQPLLIDLLNRRSIDFSTYCSLCYKLLDAGYVFTSINDKIIFQIIKEDNFMSSGRLDIILLGLRQPTIEGLAIDIAVKVIKSIWMGLATPEQRRFILDKILFNLSIGRSIDRVLNHVMRKVNIEFILAPLQLLDIQNEIVLWRKVHISSNKINLWVPGK